MRATKSEYHDSPFPTKQIEKYTVLRSENLTTISPVKSKVSVAIFFFAGFADPMNYTNLFKNFLENSKRDDIKMIIPDLPESEVIDSPGDKVRAWYYFRNNGDKVERFYNEENDIKISGLVRKEIEQLGGEEEKVVFIGFSMGGRYASILLNKLKLKIGFLLMFKAVPLERLDDLSFQIDDEVRKNNTYYLHVSKGDEVVLYENSIRAGEKFKELGFNLKITSDDGKKHKIDKICLAHLSSLLQIHFPLNNSKY